jgi:hypothetical protein
MKWLTFSLILISFCGCKGKTKNLARSDHEIVAWGQSVSGLECRIKAERDIYYIGEKVLVALEVRNSSDVNIIIKNPPQREIRPREFTGLRSEAYVTLSQPEPVQGGFFCTQLHPFPKPGGGEESSVTLKPGETYSETFSLGKPWGPVYSALPARAHTGDAQIQATTSLDISSLGRRITLKSNLFHISVLEEEIQ